MWKNSVKNEKTQWETRKTQFSEIYTKQNFRKGVKNGPAKTHVLQSFHSSCDNFELDVYPGFYDLLITGAKFNGQETIKNSEKLTDTLTDSPSNFFRKFYGQD